VDPVTSQAGRPTSAALPAAEERRLRATAHEVESIFLSHMLKTLREASGSQGPLSGKGQRVYQELMDEQMGRALAKAGGIGLADLLVRDVLRRRGVVEKNPSSGPVPEPIAPTGGRP
jgi:peptidoglycan hydrolase FlgJ